MRTRLRLDREEQVRTPTRQAKQDLETDQAASPDWQQNPSASIMRLQQTRGNAYVRRYLNQHAANRAHHGLISRAPANSTHGNKPKTETAPTLPAPTVYITATINGTELHGSSQRPGQEGKIEGYGFSVSMGIRQTRIQEEDPVTVTVIRFSKSIDALSPIFAKAANEGAKVDIRFEFVKHDQGKEVVYLTFEATNAFISQFVMSSANKDQPMEQITIEANANDTTNFTPAEPKD